MTRLVRPRVFPSVLVAAVVFAYLACWALLRPPLQSPDEPQHLMKANAVRLQPWLNAVPDQFVHDRARVNPLALATPPGLDKLFFNRLNAVSIAEIDQLRAVPWLPPDGPPLPPYQRAVATYPQVYYWSVHLIAEPAIAAFGLTPWSASYAYRLASCALTALIWGLVWRSLADCGLAPRDAASVLGLLLATPMLAFISSAVNPDAVNDALSALAVVQAWRALSLGTGRWPFAAALLAAALIKPAGLQLAAVLAVVAGLLAVGGLVERRRAGTLIAVCVAVIAVAFAVFYLWQPQRFLGGAPANDSLGAYAARRWADVPALWRSYWGTLGWLDYFAPTAWYIVITALVAVNAGCLAWRPVRPVAPAWYLAALWLVFTASAFAAEFRFLPHAGYTLQGRYLFPAGLGLGAILLHEVRAARVALLAAVVLLNVVLMRETVHRYYVDGWRGAVHGLPLR
jgi:hypothetical protein